MFFAPTLGQPGRARLRALGAALFAGSLLAGCSAAVGSSADGASHLVVADPAEQRLYIYTIPDHELIAEFDDLEVNDHTGYLSLPDGRVLFVDDAGGYLDPSLTLVDLDSYESVQFPIRTGEPGVALGGDPLRVFHRNDETAQVEVFPVEGILDGDFTITDELLTGLAGHGEAVSPERDRLYVATDDGFEVIDIGEVLSHAGTARWDVDGHSGGRAFYVRTSSDGDHLVTYLANRDLGQPWGEWENDAYVLDLETNVPTRVPLADGYVWRMGIGEGYAIYFNLTPDGDPTGDQAHLLDLDVGSATFGTVVASIPLPALTHRAGPDEAPWMQPDAEYRRVTMTPDGRLAYVTNGGDSSISVIDTDERAIVSTIAVPSPLTGGGSITAVQTGAPLVDTIAR